LSATYCGGYRIGDGVYIQPEAPLSLPATVPPGGVSFANGSADATVDDNGVMRVVPGADRAWAQFCAAGERPFTIELLPALRLTNPDPGSYTIDVWIGSGSTPVQLAIDIT